jgi:ankyrin repeat protein
MSKAVITCNRKESTMAEIVGVTDSEKLIIKAAKVGDVTKVQELLHADSALVTAKDRDGSTPLHCASWKGHTEVVRVLIDAGADVQARNGNTHWGDTPLHAAAHGNRRAVAELLLECGAPLDVKNSNGNTPLDETRVHNAAAVATLLKKHGAV